MVEREEQHTFACENYSYYFLSSCCTHTSNDCHNQCQFSDRLAAAPGGTQGASNTSNMLSLLACTCACYACNGYKGESGDPSRHVHHNTCSGRCSPQASPTAAEAGWPAEEHGKGCSSAGCSSCTGENWALADTDVCAAPELGGVLMLHEWRMGTWCGIFTACMTLTLLQSTMQL